MIYNSRDEFETSFVEVVVAVIVVFKYDVCIITLALN